MTTITLNLPEGGTSQEVLVETACRLYDAGQLSKAAACRMCGLARVDFEAALAARGLSIVKITRETVEEDLRQSGLELPPEKD